MDAILQATGLVKRYGDKAAVDDVDLSVRAGERVALLGPNGAGKTTTLMMVLGVIDPDTGWVEIAGHRLPRERSAALANVGFSAGYMPLAERLRVHEFLRMYGELYGLSDTRSRIAAGLEHFRISGLGSSMCTELSSGQRTLIGLVKATLHRPRLLVLDEPTASLDPDVALLVRTGLRELCSEEGMALLITSHNMVEIERLCERVVFMQAGRVIADDSPEGIGERFGRGSLEDVFLHLAGVEHHDHVEPAAQKTDHPA
ncbi:ABC transporter ATP-binding protein [soil metagenome]